MHPEAYAVVYMLVFVLHPLYVEKEINMADLGHSNYGVVSHENLPLYMWFFFFVLTAKTRNSSNLTEFKSMYNLCL